MLFGRDKAVMFLRWSLSKLGRRPSGAWNFGRGEIAGDQSVLAPGLVFGRTVWRDAAGRGGCLWILCWNWDLDTQAVEFQGRCRLWGFTPRSQNQVRHQGLDSDAAQTET